MKCEITTTMEDPEDSEYTIEEPCEKEATHLVIDDFPGNIDDPILLVACEEHAIVYGRDGATIVKLEQLKSLLTWEVQ